MDKAKVGRWSVICDVCGFRFQNTEVKKRWDGLIVCEKDWEVKHPQLSIRIPKEDITPAFVRSPPDDVFLDVCTEYTRQGLAGAGVAGCMTAGYVSKASF